MIVFRYHRLIAGMTFLVVMTLNVAIAEPLISGDDRNLAKDRDKGLFTPETQGRNFDWNRPAASDILENPASASSARPYLREVRPWRAELKIEAQKPPESWTSKPVEFSAPVTISRWARPTPQQVVPNPASGVGARPFVRSVGPGIARRQGDVVNYDGKAFTEKPRKLVIDKAGGSSDGGSGVPDRKSGDLTDGGMGVPDKDQPSGGGKTPSQPAGGIEQTKQDNSGNGNAQSNDPAKDTAGDGPEKDRKGGGGGNRTDIAAAGGNDPSAKKTEESRSGAPDGAAVGAATGKPDGSPKGTGSDGNSSASKAGEPSGSEKGAAAGGGASGGESTDPDAGKGGPGIREYLAGVQVASNDASGPLATAMAKLADGISPATRAAPAASAAVTENKNPQSPIQPSPVAASEPATASRSWWQLAKSVIQSGMAFLWPAKIAGQKPSHTDDPGKAELSNLSPSVRGDIR